jgi:hypothetical protein
MEKRDQEIADLKVFTSEPEKFSMDPSRMTLSSMGGSLYGGIKKGSSLVAGEMMTGLKEVNDMAKPFTSMPLKLLNIKGEDEKAVAEIAQKTALVPIKPLQASEATEKAKEKLKALLKKKNVDKIEAMLEQTRIYFFSQALLCGLMQITLLTLSLLEIYDDKLK